MVKNQPANVGDIGFDPWVGKIPWRKLWQSISILLLENPMDRGAWRATVYSVEEADMTEVT